MNIKTLIESIIMDLTSNESISTIMLKAQAIAFYIKDEAFSNWIKLEQNGYSNKNDIPEYRKKACAVKVDLSLHHQARILYGLDFPADAIQDDFVKNYLSYIYFNNPISDLEQYCNNPGNGVISENVIVRAFPYINKHYPKGNIEGAHKIADISSVKSIIDIVKSKLLEFFLNFEEQIDLNINFDVMANKEKIKNIYNQTINAGVVNNGNGNITISQSEIIGGNENVTITKSDKNNLEEIISEIENINARYNNTDIANEIEEIKVELQKSQQNPRFIKRAFNTIKGIAVGIAANEFTLLVDKGLELIRNIF